MTLQCLYGTVKKGMGYLAVPVGNHNTEPHARGVGHT
jgi:hypothetical protein